MSEDKKKEGEENKSRHPPNRKSAKGRPKEDEGAVERE